MRLSVVVPTFNEALNIEDTVSAALCIGDEVIVPVRTLCAWGIVQGLYSLGVPPWALAKLYPDTRRCDDAEYQG
jgi:hypothetical protein